MKRVVLVASIVFLVVGLLFCGPAHAALHNIGPGDSHADSDGTWCMGCSLSSLESPAPISWTAPVLHVLRFLHPVLVHVLPAPPLLTHSPRGPPAHA